MNAPIDTDQGWTAYLDATKDLDQLTTRDMILYLAMLVAAALCCIAAVIVATKGGW